MAETPPYLSATPHARCTCTVYPSGSPNVPGLYVTVQNHEEAPFAFRVGDKTVTAITKFRQHTGDAARGVFSLLAETTVYVSDDTHTACLAAQSMPPAPIQTLVQAPVPIVRFAPPTYPPKPDNVASEAIDYEPETPVLLKACLEKVRRLVDEAERWSEEERLVCAEIDEKLKLLGDDETRAEKLCNSALTMVDQACSRRAEREKTYERIAGILDKL